MKYAIEILKENQSTLIEELRKNNMDREISIEKVSEIKKAITWLSKIEELQLDEVSKYEIVKLPDMQAGWSEFRIMNDCETDDRKYWIEFDKHSGLIQGDPLCIIKKE